MEDKKQRLRQLKDWLNKSQENLQKEYEKRYSRIADKSDELVENPDNIEPDMFVNIYKHEEDKRLSSGMIHFDSIQAKERAFNNGFEKCIGTYKLVKI